MGARYADPPERGQRIVTLASLTLTPLRLTEVVRLDPDDPQLEVRGTAYVCDRSAWGPVPEDLPLETVLAVYDVYGAGSLTHALAPKEGGTVCVLGAGHAGNLALPPRATRCRAARSWLSTWTTGRSGWSSGSGCATSASPPTCATRSAPLEALRTAGAPPADLTVVVVNATGCEPTAILLTADTGTVLFFSMATNFSTAALRPTA